MHYITAAALQLFLLLSQSSFGAVSREDEAHPFDDSKVRRLWEVAERREEQHDLRGCLRGADSSSRGLAAQRWWRCERASE